MLKAADDRMRGKRVLVVEDEAMIAMQIAYDLRDAGCEVVGPAASVERAMQLMDSEEFDAALLDYRLVHETSLEIARALIGRGTPFVIMSGHCYGDLPNELHRQALLQKPAKSTAILAALEGVLETHS
jgi:DNA-binding response OmpR family regulator